MVGNDNDTCVAAHGCVENLSSSFSLPRRRGENVLRPTHQLSPAGQVPHSISIWELRRVLAREILSGGGGSKVTRQIGRGRCDDTLLGLVLRNESFLCEASTTSAGLQFSFWWNVPDTDGQTGHCHRYCYSLSPTPCQPRRT